MQNVQKIVDNCGFELTPIAHCIVTGHAIFCLHFPGETRDAATVCDGGYICRGHLDSLRGPEAETIDPAALP
jgi:hypothetical protein